MVGLPWEQHVAFLDDRGAPPRSRRGCAPASRAAPGIRPALLRGRQRDPGADRALARPPRASSASSSGSAARVQAGGPRRPRHLRQLSRAPSTSSCRSLDFVSLQRLPRGRASGSAAYVARLQNLAGERPLLMAEIGLDSRSHGREAAGGGARLAGATRVRGRLRGHVRLRLDRRVAPRRRRGDDWDFGSTDRERRPKPALAAVRARVRRGAVRADADGAAHLGRRLHLQRRRARSATASTAWRGSTTRTTR